jgi:hypothetical protein
MNADQNMKQAAILLARLQFQQGISPEAQSVASFVSSVIIPLMCEPPNSKAYKDARRSLLDRGRAAKGWMQEKKVLDKHLEGFLA